jgi:PPOX class probable F420-dependent enzyme
MLSERIQELAGAAHVAVLSTVRLDGTVQSHLMWVHHDGEFIIMNTEIHRPKFKNIERDPRVTVVLMDKEDPYSFVEVRGTVVETVPGPVARQNIEDLSHKYMGRPYSSQIQSERVILKIQVDKTYGR